MAKDDPKPVYILTGIPAYLVLTWVLVASLNLAYDIIRWLV